MAKILIADGSMAMRMLLIEILSDVPGCFVVGTASDAAECLRRLRDLSPHVVLLDVELPGAEEAGVLAAVAATGKTKAVLLSAADHDMLRRIGATSCRAAVDIVPKPSGPISLDLEACAGPRIIAAVRAAARL